MRFLPLLEKILILNSIMAFGFLVGFDFSSIWLLLSLMLLASFYMIATPFLVQSILDKKLKEGTEIQLLLTAQVLISIAIVGILFKVMVFSGASTLLLASALGLLFIAIVISLKQLVYDSIILQRIIVFGLLAAFLYWLPSTTWIRFRFWQHPNFANSYIRYLENPGDSTAKAVWQHESSKLDPGK